MDKWGTISIGECAIIGFDHGFPCRVKTWSSGLSNDKNLGFGLSFCLLSPSGHGFYTARETMIKSYSIYHLTLLSSNHDDKNSYSCSVCVNWNSCFILRCEAGRSFSYFQMYLAIYCSTVCIRYLQKITKMYTGQYGLIANDWCGRLVILRTLR